VSPELPVSLFQVPLELEFYGRIHQPRRNLENHHMYLFRSVDLSGCSTVGCPVLRMGMEPNSMQCGSNLPSSLEPTEHVESGEVGKPGYRKGPRFSSEGVGYPIHDLQALLGWSIV